MLDIGEFLFPHDLEIEPTAFSRCLFIGSCVAEAYVLHFRKQKPNTHIDFIIFNNVGDVGEAPPHPIADYDFTYVQLPVRHVIGDIAIDFTKFTDARINDDIVANSLAALELMLDAAMKFNRESGALTLVQNFFVPQTPVAAGLGNVGTERDLRHLIEKLNLRLCELIGRYKNAYLIDADAIASAMGKRHFLDDWVVFYTHGSFWYADWANFERGRIESVPPIESISPNQLHPFFEAVWRACEYHHRVVNQTDSVKLVIFDLDDTLWRGLIGEHYSDEGPRPTTAGWPLGVHEAIHHLKARGILVAVCSKNDPNLVASRWERAVPLNWIKLEDFVCVEIGWAPKAEAVGRIMAEVNLTPRNVVFVDDNPVERASVKEAYPNIRVMGANPFHTRRILLNASETQVRVLTSESAQRDRMVRSQREREAERKTLSREEFLKNLNCRVDFREIVSSDDPAFGRTFELLNKTNQFNTNGKRWSPLEMEQHFSGGGSIVAFNVGDKFTEYGLVGVLLVAGIEIVQFAMSCRVLGLDVEKGAIHSVVNALAERRPSEPIVASIVPTDANFVCRDVYTKCGFTEEGAGRFSCIAARLGSAPEHLALSSIFLRRKLAREPHMSNSSVTDHEFLAHANGLEGWLDPFTAARTVDLLNYQQKNGLRGPVYEIGVYWGKYFSILLRGADQQGDHAYGFDIFQYNTLDQLKERFRATSNLISSTATPRCTFIAGNSADLSERELGAIIGGAARFVSIDGSHNHDEVFWDLTIAERVLAPHGIIAADDFLNSTCIGTNEAINRFLMTNPNVAPVAYVAGKLFISRPAWAERYKKEIERSALADSTSPKAKTLQANIDNNTRFNIETQFHRRLTLMIP